MTQPADCVEAAQPWLNLCGSCDLGLPYTCNCPNGDYRPVMLALYQEVQRLRALLGEPV